MVCSRLGDGLLALSCAVLLACGGGTGTDDPGEPGVVTEWDGQTCPGGGTLATDPVDVHARWCESGGKRSGPFGRWYPPGPEAGGAREVLGQYSGGLASGTWATYYESGGIAETGAYRDGERDGGWRFLRADGSLESDGTYAAGVLSGAWKTYARDGGVAEAGAYVAGERGGVWTRYGAAGQVVETTTWAAGLRDGLYERFYADGGAAETGTYAADRRQGTWTLWHPGGEKQTEGAYDRGTKTGLWRGWMPDGRPDFEGPYVASLAHGTWTFWEYALPSPIRRRTGEFRSGAAVGAWKVIWETGGAGTVQEEYAYVGGLPHGPTRGFWQDGTPWWVGFYSAGQRDGAWMIWHSNGQLAAQGEYADGERTGDWTCFDASGQPTDCEGLL
ncbi:MAG: hypothetical protein R3F39_10860 [Myxococcota bacterium]